MHAHHAIVLKVLQHAPSVFLYPLVPLRGVGGGGGGGGGYAMSAKLARGVCRSF